MADTVIEGGTVLTMSGAGSIEDGTVLTARQALRMATIDGARAIGRGDELGSIEAGKRADLLVYDLDQSHLNPVHDVVSTIVYQSLGHEVMTTLCDGEVVYDAEEPTGIEQAYPQVGSEAQDVSDALLERAGIDRQSPP